MYDSYTLLSPLGRVDFTSEANKSRERSLLSYMLRAFTLFAIKTSIVLTFISFRQATFPKGESKNKWLHFTKNVRYVAKNHYFLFTTFISVTITVSLCKLLKIEPSEVAPT